MTLTEAVEYCPRRIADLLYTGMQHPYTGELLVGRRAFAYKAEGFRCAQVGALYDMYSLLASTDPELVKAELDGYFERGL